MRIQKMVPRKSLPFLLIFTGAVALVFGVLSLQQPKMVQANSNDLNIAVSTYPNIANTGLDSCSLCHTSAPNLNVYGQAYLAHGRNAAALKAIETLDSDQDSFSNIVEINALSFPGDPNSLPLATLTATPTATSTPTGTLTPTQTSTPFATSEATATETGTPGATEAATDTPEATVAATDTPEATLAATDTPEATEAPTSTSEATLAATATETVTPGTVVLTPQADAYVSRRHPDENYGTQKTLRIDESPADRAYLRFDLSGVDLSGVEKVELRVYVTDSSNRGFLVREVKSNHWDENKIHFSNAPEVGEVIGRSGEPEAGKWITVDVTSGITGRSDGDNDRDNNDKDDKEEFVVTNGQISLALLGSSDNGLSIASRESGDHVPQLIITMKK